LEREGESREIAGEIYKMGVEGRTPGYMVRKEFQRMKIRSRAERRAWGFEERMEGRGSVLAQRC